MSININYIRDAHIDVPFPIFERLQHWPVFDASNIGEASCPLPLFRGELGLLASGGEADPRDRVVAVWLTKEVLPLMVGGVNDVHFHPDPEWRSALPAAVAPVLTDSSLFGGAV